MLPTLGVVGRIGGQSDKQINGLNNNACLEAVLMSLEKNHY